MSSFTSCEVRSPCEAPQVARQGAARRLRETEATVAAERRCLMNDLEAFEEKRRSHGSEALKLENERRQLQEDVM